MSGMNDVIVTQPNDDEVIAWWKWAAQFPKNTSPFELGWGNQIDRNAQNQPSFVFCVSCTAGNLGTDNEIRPLDAARASGNDILVPVNVAFADNLNDAKTILGNPQLHFLVNGNPQDPFYKETFVDSVNFVFDNSFDETPGTKAIYSAGFWAKVSPGGLLTIEFGGTGGQVNLIDTNTFQTLVTYE